MGPGNRMNGFPNSQEIVRCSHGRTMLNNDLELTRAGLGHHVFNGDILDFQ